MVAFNKYYHILAFSIVFGLILTDATTITAGQVASSVSKVASVNPVK